MKQRSDYTFKYNTGLGRHGWLRLTPAYSVKLVDEIIGGNGLFDGLRIKTGSVLDPFCGTGTTGLVAANRGLDCTLYEINPFLTWFASAKSFNYDNDVLEEFMTNFLEELGKGAIIEHKGIFIPQMKNIERWWNSDTLTILGKIADLLKKRYYEPDLTNSPHNLLWVAFARLVMDCSAADFAHISVSFKEETSTYGESEIIDRFKHIINEVFSSAQLSHSGKMTIIKGDSRNPLEKSSYTTVITSPPYPNRISYIRELRPYMYWLGFLHSGEEAGELDWEAIGGTWGVATSRLNKWEADWEDVPQELSRSVNSIKAADSRHGYVLSQYVLKYFYDLNLHLSNLRENLAEKANLYYVLGNSSFYGVPVKTDEITVHLLQSLGYKESKVRVIRKRNSKKELFEYLITAIWP